MRKGLSPLIATVLLIAFTIAVAGIVSNFLIDFSSSKTEDTTTRAGQEIECASSSLFIRDAVYNSTSDEISLTVRNNGRRDLTDFVFNAVWDNNTQTTLTTDPNSTVILSPGDEVVFENASLITTCSDVQRLVFRSNTCPNDARDEIVESDITSC